MVTIVRDESANSGFALVAGLRPSGQFRRRLLAIFTAATPAQRKFTFGARNGHIGPGTPFVDD
jgi:hypothetical protein